MSPITLENEKAIKPVAAKIRNLPAPPIIFTQITNVKQAIVIPGLEAIKSLVISASDFETFVKMAQGAS